MKKLILILIAVLLLVARSRHEPTLGQVANKYEHEGKQYLTVEIQVSPEEYIGYDIGDEYRTN